MATVSSYRGFRIERVVGVTQMGHTLPNSRSLKARLGMGTKRKISGYELTYPDSGGKKFVDTLKEAKAYIDAYEGTNDD